MHFLKKILFTYFQRGEGREKEGNKHQCVVVSYTPPTGDLAHNPGKSPDWKSNWRSFDLQAATQSTEPHQPVLNCIFYWHIFLVLHELCMSNIKFIISSCAEMSRAVLTAYLQKRPAYKVGPWLEYGNLDFGRVSIPCPLR